MPTTSIIIPTYNCGRYLREAIQSALAQTYKDLEVLVVDDGSTDDTRDIVRPYVEQATITYLHQPHQGPGAARNRGILEAKSPYVAFLDADDTLIETSVEQRLALMAHEPHLDFVFSDHFRRSQEFVQAERYMPDFATTFSRLTRPSPHGLVLSGSFGDLCEAAFHAHTNTVLIRKHVFNKVGLFSTSFFTHEDIEMWMRIARECSIGYVDRPTAYYNAFRSNGPRFADPLKAFQDRLDALMPFLRHPNRKGALPFIKRRISWIHYERGVHYQRTGHLSLARRDLLKSLSYYPNNPWAYKALALSFLPGRIRRAAAEFRRP